MLPHILALSGILMPAPSPVRRVNTPKKRRQAAIGGGAEAAEPREIDFTPVSPTFKQGKLVFDFSSSTTAIIKEVRGNDTVVLKRDGLSPFKSKGRSINELIVVPVLEPVLPQKANQRVLINMGTKSIAKYIGKKRGLGHYGCRKVHGGG